MAFTKTARAKVVKPSTNRAAWEAVRRAATVLSPSFDGRIAANVTLQEYDPERFLLTHCTIIASVDTETPGDKLGKQVIDGFEIDRKYADYLVAPGTTKYVNNNFDCWERKLLLSTFRSFVGGENYVEHIQIPALSKGKIIDAVARDIGDSIYVDILVATERRHEPLITAITNNQLGTLSMGAQVAFTICTRCGNVAEDETQLCAHIKYAKGNMYVDERGVQRKIAELCGHVSAEPGSCKFIEASWVANPAFTGAVLRNVIFPPDMAPEVARRIQVAFAQPTRVTDPLALQKAAHKLASQIGDLDFLFDAGRVVASCRIPARGARFEVLPGTAVLPQLPRSTRVALFGLDDQGGDQGGEEEDLDQNGTPVPEEEPEEDTSSPGAEAPPMAPDVGDAATPKGDALDKIVEDLYGAIRDRIVERIHQEIGGKDGQSKPSDARVDENENETLIKSACVDVQWRKRARIIASEIQGKDRAIRIIAGLVALTKSNWGAVKKRGLTSADLLAISHYHDRFTKRATMAGMSRVYRTVIAVRGTGKHRDLHSYLTACREVLGREPTHQEKIALVRKGQIYALGRDSSYTPSLGQERTSPCVSALPGTAPRSAPVPQRAVVRPKAPLTSRP